MEDPGLAIELSWRPLWLERELQQDPNSNRQVFKLQFSSKAGS